MNKEVLLGAILLSVMAVCFTACDGIATKKCYCYKQMADGVTVDVRYTDEGNRCVSLGIGENYTCVEQSEYVDPNEVAHTPMPTEGQAEGINEAVEE